MSGSSTPRSAVTPPPPAAGDGPQPLTVGVRFVREYYKTLSTKPETITRFYQPTSMLSVGLGSQQSHPVKFEAKKEKDMKSRFVLEGLEDWKTRFEFENGAIDAQMSVNGGILVVATGHIVYESQGKEAGACRKAFVHTFFLGSVSSGNKRSYYVHNDVLRFLADVEEKTVVASNKAGAVAEKEIHLPVAMEDSPAELGPTESTPSVEAAPEPSRKESAPVVEEKNTTSHTTKSKEAAPTPAAAAATPVVGEEGAPGGGVEESKEAVIAEEEVVETKSAKKEETKATKKVVETKDEAAAAIKEPPVPVKPTKFSWASVVGTDNGTAPSSQPSTPARGGAATQTAASPPKTPKASPAEGTAETASNAKGDSTSNANNNTGGNKNARIQHNKRDPDCTLVIKNFDTSSTTEADIRGMFEPYAGENEAKVIGCTVSSHKGLAFVDYDSPKPVLAAVEKHKKEALKLKGYTLDIYQKTVDKPSSRRNQGGRGTGRGNQSGGGGGGGGRPYRRSGSGVGRGERGERGGGGGGRGRGGR